ncbi:hypothetical protein ACQEVF_47710 [Nonomuraea polychroma]|uniref:hypothetical protein n=1 Tax=Nonomuraea polychroma TaxID=46176 RepID=UPI003D8C3A69
MARGRVARVLRLRLLHPVVDAEVAEVTAGESHAWVEFWVGDWVALDPTSLADLGSRHVLPARVAGTWP